MTASDVERVRGAAGPEPLHRAQERLLRAALRQIEELEDALASERHLRRREVDRVREENELLRHALAALHASALEGVQEPSTGPAEQGSDLVPAQRDPGALP